MICHKTNQTGHPSAIIFIFVNGVSTVHVRWIFNLVPPSCFWSFCIFAVQISQQSSYHNIGILFVISINSWWYFNSWRVCCSIFKVNSLVNTVEYKSNKMAEECLVWRKSNVANWSLFLLKQFSKYLFGS